MNRRGAVAAALLAIATAGTAEAAKPKKGDADAAAQVPPEAQQRFLRALELYDEGNLDAARTELARAYDIAPHFKLLYNMGQIAFELHDYPAALAAFEKYLSEGGRRSPKPAGNRSNPTSRSSGRAWRVSKSSPTSRRPRFESTMRPSVRRRSPRR